MAQTAQVPIDRSYYPPLAEDIVTWERPFSTGPLTKDEYEQFFQDGFVIKYNVLPEEQLKGVISGVKKAVEELAQELFQAGKIKSLYEDVGFYQRLTAIDQEFPGAAVLLHKRGILPPEIASLWSSDFLLGVAKQLLGPNIAGHPVWNLRAKVPNQEQVTVPWHQDTAYLNNECWKVLQVTAWIPLLDANKENGCLQMLRGGHRPGITCSHNCCAGGTWYVEVTEQEMASKLNIPVNDQTVLTCEVPFGSVVFFNNLIPHRSLENFSQNIRWSLDLRWQKPDQPNGFYGLKDSILMAKENDENFKPDWDVWAKINRAKLQEAAVKEEIKNEIPELKEKIADDPFDTTISGPWMHNWPIIHHNRHTAKLKSNATSWHKA